MVTLPLTHVVRSIGYETVAACRLRTWQRHSVAGVMQFHNTTVACDSRFSRGTCNGITKYKGSLTAFGSALFSMCNV